ncbi:MAG: gamma-glutamyl-gamma-aminobutyrate hydrolase family protein [Thermomicrobiales bacterium]
MKPLVGITPAIGDTEDRGALYRMEVSYVNAVRQAGGVPVLLPYASEGVEELLAVLDGLLLSGGGDIRPERFGDAEQHPQTYGISDERDEFEFVLLQAALARDLPVLAICRGIQVLNVALGGTLYQDVADQFSDTITHRQPWNTESWVRPTHDVALDADSTAANVYGATTVATNSAHHQTVKEVAPGLRVTGRSSDGSIEAVDYPGKQFVLGVQWHPEKMFEDHAEHRRPFARLVQEAAGYQARKRLGAAAAD